MMQIESLDGLELPNVDALVTEMLDTVQRAPVFGNLHDSDWNIVHQEETPVRIFVFRSVSKPERFKTLIELEYPLEKIVDYCTKITNRPKWDDFCVEAKILYEIDENTQIHYSCSRRLLTVSGRDLVNIFHRRKLNGNSWVTCARSITTDKIPEYSGKVRATANLIGILFERHPENPNHTRLMQINDLDSKMSLPSFFMSFLASKAIPGGIRNLNKALKNHIENSSE